MFKLVKILSSGTNAPEYCRIQTAPNTLYRPGMALTLSGNGAIMAEGSTRPLLISAEHADSEKDATVLCYHILSSMIFEVPVEGSVEDLKCGDTVGINSENGFSERVSNVPGSGAATVIDTANAKNSGDHVFVRFI